MKHFYKGIKLPTHKELAEEVGVGCSSISNRAHKENSEKILLLKLGMVKKSKTPAPVLDCLAKELEGTSYYINTSKPKQKILMFLGAMLKAEVDAVVDYSDYKNALNVKELVTLAYHLCIPAKPLIDEILKDEWEGVAFSSFIHIAADEYLLVLLDLITIDDEVRKFCDDKAVYNDFISKDWDLCSGFANREDFIRYWNNR